MKDADTADPVGSRPERPSLVAGTVFGRYLIEDVLGEGGMGRVYRARDERLKRRVALKVISAPAGDARAAEREKRFLREAQAAAALDHPNLVSLYDVGEVDGRSFIAMELVAGKTLRAYVGAAEPSWPTRLRWLVDVASALSAAHRAGLIHRDIKPENVMRRDDGRIKVLDFGIARRFDAPVDGNAATTTADLDLGTVTREGGVLGTPLYMAPELVRDEPLDGRADQFAWGVLAFELLAGRPPWTGNAVTLLASVLSKEAPPLGPLVPELPAAVCAAVARALAKTPDGRHASMEEAAAALEPYLPTAVAVTTGAVAVLRSAAGADVLPARAAAGASRRGGVRGWGLRQPAGRVRPLLAGLVLVSAAALAGAAWIAAATRAPAGFVPERAGGPGGAGPGHARALTDDPPPRTANAGAASAYAAALQSLRDASVSLAGAGLDTAARLDPALAPAHLQLVLERGFGLSPSAREEHYTAAARLRGSLDERDRALLHAAEAIAAEPTDWTEVARRLKEAQGRFPDDAETAYLLGSALHAAGRLEDGAAALARATELDASYALPLLELGGFYRATEPARALALYDRCLAVAPLAASCLRHRAGLHRDGGQCKELEADARRMTALEPTGPRSFEFLAVALAAQGAPVDSVRAVLDRWLTARGGGEANALVVSAALAPLTGDFTAAEAAVNAFARTVDGDPNESGHDGPARALMDLFEESGQPERALEVAEAFERRLPAWTADAPLGVRLRLLYLRHHAHRLDDAAFRRARDALFTEACGRLPAGETDLAWLAAYVARAETPGEVSEALGGLSTRKFTDVRGLSEGVIGRAYLLAGQADEAIPSLRRAAASCSVFPHLTDRAFSATFEHTRAHLALGQALEAKGLNAEACSAYAVVLKRWGHAIPRSVTAEKAKARATALRCAP